MSTIRIIIADDHPLMRKGLKDVILEEGEGIEVSFEAADGEKALELIRKHKPSVAVLDIDMPKLSGIEVVKTLTKERSETGVVILTMHDEKQIFDRAMNAGALGYVLKENAANDIVAAILQVASGKPYVSPTLSRHLIRTNVSMAEGIDKKLGLSNLTAAERKVFKLIALGKSSNEIAEELFISPKTVGHHRTHICDKLEITGPNALLKFALENKDLV